ncbi:MAG: RsmF rRNA methyltransferase first C-terminal domain-containing protein [Clostridium sp.]|jgi:16S rRNA C967 or C1407 C5-methylase (RsmB/RsmF family)/NOL1/NOP2/fmu family ribosome biogenesis protein|nr:RsmF rRNA methyltransferase first C-terminal domain-containing protein [Clostridium sp.]
MLPEAFLERMRRLLGEEDPEFLSCFGQEGHRALRFNTRKGDGRAVPEPERLFPELSFSQGSRGFPENPFLRENSGFPEGAFFQARPFPPEGVSPQSVFRRVSWAPHGWYYPPDLQPGGHPYHAAGLYYIQEPSAMAPAGLLQAQPGTRVLDLCAAPGGKSVQLADRMKGQGVLVCNDIHPARARILSENVERMGIRNALVTNERPERLSGFFPLYFDEILVDAPCSGEGMFRKSEEARTQWSLEAVRACAKRQDGILEEAAAMLRPGGRLVYSTCTFAPLENEGTVSRFLARHAEFSVSVPPWTPGMSQGRSAWTENPAPGLEHTIRLWPHKIKGEGHFMALLQKAGEPESAQATQKCRNLGKKRKDSGFRAEFLRTGLSGSLLTFGGQLYLAPPEFPSLQGLKVLRPGLHLGTQKKNRFEPSHALALTLSPEDVSRHKDLAPDGETVRAYLNGQTFPAEGEDGWHLITTGGYSIGWGKLSGGVMKNHYPKGLRVSQPKASTETAAVGGPG